MTKPILGFSDWLLSINLVAIGVMGGAQVFMVGGQQEEVIDNQEIINKRIKVFGCLHKLFKGKGTLEEKLAKHGNIVVHMFTR